MPLPYPTISDQLTPGEWKARHAANDAYRERLDVAKHCLAGLLSSVRADDHGEFLGPLAVAALAVECADALLAELAKPKATDS